jgi:tight adherence protein B
VVSRARLLAPAALLLLLAASPAAAEVGTSVREVDTDGFPTVRVTVSSASAGVLSVAHVRVEENGVPVTVTTVDTLDSVGGSVDAVLAIDTSNSMADELPTALAAARTFLADLPEDVPVGLIGFAGEVVVLSPVSSDRAALQATLASLPPTTTKGTSLYDAVDAAAGLFATEDGAQHNIIVLTDGRNTTGVQDLEGAVAAADGVGATVSTIALPGPDNDAATLQGLASETSGSYTEITPEDLSAVYGTLAKELSQQYVIEYASKAPYGVPVTVDVVLPNGVAQVAFDAPRIEPGVGPAREPVPAEAPSTLGLALVVGLTFLAAFGLMLNLMRVRERRRRLEQLQSRLASTATVAEAGGEEDQAPARKGSSVGSLIPAQIAEVAERGVGTSTSASLRRQLTRAGWSIRPGEFLAGTFLLFGIGLVAGFVTLGPVGAVAAGMAAALVPNALLGRAASKRLATFQSQLADILMVIASSLRAGHSFLQSLDTVTKEIVGPGAEEFTRVLTEIRLGRSVEAALDALVERMVSQDLEWTVTAIKIQREIGGNLAEILETVARTIRERETLRRQVRVLAAEGRISVVVLTVLPILVAAYLMTVNPSYLQTLTRTDTGVVLLAAGGSLLLIGYLWMQRITKLDV